MLHRRKLITGGTALLAAPYFYFPTTIKAKSDALNDGLVANITRVVDNMSMRPAGRQDGTNVQVAGGGTVYGRSVNNQANYMARDANFTEVQTTTEYTRSVCANSVGYTFARFQRSFRNCCLPMGVVGSQELNVGYAGAMTLLEGPNLVALRVLTDVLRERRYSAEQITDLCWPLAPSFEAKRERALILFTGITRLSQPDDGYWYADRDVLKAKSARCALLYSHDAHGTPDGGGRAGLYVDGREELRVEFQYNLEHLRS
jgi:hypothetical protein